MSPVLAMAVLKKVPAEKMGLVTPTARGAPRRMQRTPTGKGPHEPYTAKSLTHSSFQAR